MKIKDWNKLNNIGIYYDITKSKWYKITKIGKRLYLLYREKCNVCGEPFLAYRSSKGLYCNKNCSYKDHIGENNSFYGKTHTKKTRKKISEFNKGRKHTEETKIKIGNASRESNNSNWKGGITKKNIPSYETYSHKLDWCEEIRRNSEDINILEVKCTYCGRWYIPTFRSVCNRINVINKYKGYKGEQRFYCSDGCKRACPIYGKSAETLMKEDAIRAGRLNWLELNREVQPQLRQMVLKRDEYKCVKCETTEELHCHHIYPVATDPLLSADIDNCITLCVKCHKQVHKQDGCKYGELNICI